MKKTFAILVSLLFVASVFGIASMTAKYPATATPEEVKVGELITVTSPTNPYYDETCYDPDIKIYNQTIGQGLYDVDDPVYANLQDASSYVVKVSGPIEIYGEYIWIWTYRAVQPGTIVFGFPVDFRSPPHQRNVTNPVTITKNSYPMLNFMKILGLGKTD